MEYLLSRLISHISEEMPSLSVVDEDYGQLEAIDRDDVDMYPLTFPSVLINAEGTDWSCLSDKSQKGVANITFKLVIDCYDDTHANSGTVEAVTQRQELVNKLHNILQKFRPVDDGELIRVKSKFYTWNHGIKVYEMTYTLVVTDIICQTTTIASQRISLSLQTRKSVF